MQETLTGEKDMYSFYYRKRKRKTKLGVFLLCTLLCVILMVTLLCVSFNYNTDYYKSRTFYMLSVYKTSVKNKVDFLSEQVKSVNGAGYVYKEDNEYHLLAFGYFSEDDINTVIEQNPVIYESGEVIKIESKSLKRKVKKLLNQNPLLKNIYLEIISLPNDYYSIVSDYDKGGSVAKVYRNLEEIRVKIESFLSRLNSLEDNEDVKDIFVVSLNVNLAIIKACLDEVYKMSGVSRNLKNLFISCCFEEINMKTMLNKL